MQHYLPLWGRAIDENVVFSKFFSSRLPMDHFFVYIAHFVILGDDWIRTQRAFSKLLRCLYFYYWTFYFICNRYTGLSTNLQFVVIGYQMKTPLFEQIFSDIRVRKPAMRKIPDISSTCFGRMVPKFEITC